MTTDLVLVGVSLVVGALATGAWNLGMAARRDRQDRRGITRIMQTELLEAWGVLSAVVEHNAWDALNRLPPTPTWDEHQLALARIVTDRAEWDTVSNAYVSYANLRRTVPVVLAEQAADAADTTFRDSVAYNFRQVTDALDQLKRHGDK